MRMNFTYLRREIESLKAEQRKLRYTAYGMIALLLLVILISVWKLYYLTLFFLALVILLQLFYFRRKQKAYQKKMQRVNLLTVTGGLLGTEEIEEKGGAGLSTETLRKAELLAYQEKGKEVNFYLGMKGNYEKMQLITADAAIVQFYGGDSRKAEINCGNWTHISLPKGSGLDLRILDTSAMRQSTRQEFFSGLPELRESPAGDWGIEGNYLLYHRISATGEEKLPRSFVEKLKELTAYTPGKIAISIRGQDMDVYIRNRFLGRNFPVHTEPSEQLLSSDPYPELEKILKLAASLI